MSPQWHEAFRHPEADNLYVDFLWKEILVFTYHLICLNLEKHRNSSNSFTWDIRVYVSTYRYTYGYRYRHTHMHTDIYVRIYTYAYLYIGPEKKRYYFTQYAL